MARGFPKFFRSFILRPVQGPASFGVSVRGHGLKAGEPRQVRKEATAACPSLSWFPDGLSFSGLSFSGRCMGDGFLMFCARASRGAHGADEFIVTKSLGNPRDPVAALESWRIRRAPRRHRPRSESQRYDRERRQVSAYSAWLRRVADTSQEVWGGGKRRAGRLPMESKGRNLASLCAHDSRNLRDSCFAAARCCFHSWFSSLALR